MAATFQSAPQFLYHTAELRIKTLVGSYTKWLIMTGFDDIINNLTCLYSLIAYKLDLGILRPARHIRSFPSCPARARSIVQYIRT